MKGLIFHMTVASNTPNKPNLSTKMPACTAWTMLRKRGLSSLRRSITTVCRVKVEASQSRTSDGTESDRMSPSWSSGSTSRLQGDTHQTKSQKKDHTFSPKLLIDDLHQQIEGLSYSLLDEHTIQLLCRTRLVRFSQPIVSHVDHVADVTRIYQRSDTFTFNWNVLPSFCYNFHKTRVDYWFTFRSAIFCVTN